MSPISLPTDNLYKFCAFTGLLIIILSVYAIWTSNDSLQRKLIWLTRDASIYAAEMETLEPVGKGIDNADKTSEELKPPGEGASIEEKQLYIEKTKEQIKQRTDQIAILKTQISKVRQQGEEWRKAFYRIVDMNATMEEIVLSAKQLRTIKWAGGTFVAIGSILASYGFVNWRRIQRLQDQQLLQELKD